jgi:serine/threonine protein kinase
MENLASSLSIFHEVLRAVQILHTHHVTHYDLKCDNVFLDFTPEPVVILGDFGECRLFVNEEDEVCLRNLGTDFIKSPEMLNLTIAARKETNDYDRRRRVGTTRLSDIWSLGCLLFELLTGEFLFYHEDWVHFYIRVTQPQEDLIT